MNGPPRDDEEPEDDGARDIARAIREIQGDPDRPIAREEAKELKRLRERLPKPSRDHIRDLAKRLARPKED